MFGVVSAHLGSQPMEWINVETPMWKLESMICRSSGDEFILFANLEHAQAWFGINRRCHEGLSGRLLMAATKRKERANGSDLLWTYNNPTG